MLGFFVIPKLERALNSKIVNKDPKTTKSCVCTIFQSAAVYVTSYMYNLTLYLLTVNSGSCTAEVNRLAMYTTAACIAVFGAMSRHCFCVFKVKFHNTAVSPRPTPLSGSDLQDCLLYTFLLLLDCFLSPECTKNWCQKTQWNSVRVDFFYCNKIKQTNHYFAYLLFNIFNYNN